MIRGLVWLLFLAALHEVCHVRAVDGCDLCIARLPRRERRAARAELDRRRRAELLGAVMVGLAATPRHGPDLP